MRTLLEDAPSNTMTRYYFDLQENGNTVPDEEGMDFSSLRSVQREAVQTRGDLARGMEFDVMDPGPQKAAVAVRDDDGPVLNIDFMVSWNVFRQ